MSWIVNSWNAFQTSESNGPSCGGLTALLGCGGAKPFVATCLQPWRYVCPPPSPIMPSHVGADHRRRIPIARHNSVPAVARSIFMLSAKNRDQYHLDVIENRSALNARTSFCAKSAGEAQPNNYNPVPMPTPTLGGKLLPPELLRP